MQKALPLDLKIHNFNNLSLFKSSALSTLLVDTCAFVIWIGARPWATELIASVIIQVWLAGRERHNNIGGPRLQAILSIQFNLQLFPQNISAIIIELHCKTHIKDWKIINCREARRGKCHNEPGCCRGLPLHNKLLHTCKFLQQFLSKVLWHNTNTIYIHIDCIMGYSNKLTQDGNIFRDELHKKE